MQAIRKGSGLEGLARVVKNFFKKLLKKVLTKVSECGIIVKLSGKSGERRSLKIEQQEISTKHCKCEILDLVKRVIYTQQSKRS